MMLYGESPICELLKTLPPIDRFVCSNTKRYVSKCKPFIPSNKTYFNNIEFIDIKPSDVLIELQRINSDAIYDAFKIPKEFRTY